MSSVLKVPIGHGMIVDIVMKHLNVPGFDTVVNPIILPFHVCHNPFLDSSL